MKSPGPGRVPHTALHIPHPPSRQLSRRPFLKVLNEASLSSSSSSLTQATQVLQHLSRAATQVSEG